jgi:endonuclease IV
MSYKCESGSHRFVCTTPPKIRVIDQHHRVGCNVPLRETILDTITQPVSEGSHCIQFYLGPNNKYSCVNINSYDRKESIKYCDKYGKNFYVHCPNNTNLARDAYNNILIGTTNIIQRELYQIRDMPGSCIVHIGSVGTIQNVVNNLNDMNVSRGSHYRSEKQLILENAAGAGTKLGWNWEQLRHIYEGIDRNTIGLCIDTQHIFGAGTNCLQTHEDVVKLFDKSQEVYGRDPDVIHLNDSLVQYGDRIDRHEGLRRGHIWYQSDEGLKSLLDYCYSEDIDLILETPTSSQDLNDIRTKYMDLQTIDTYK